MKALKNERILITGPTGQIAFPMAVELARDNEVWGIARFKDESKRKRLESLGIRTRSIDLANPDFRDLPDDFTCVIHMAAFIGPKPNFDRALTVNAEGTGLLMDTAGRLVRSSVCPAAPYTRHRKIRTMRSRSRRLSRVRRCHTRLPT